MKQADQVRRGQRTLLRATISILIGVALVAGNGCGSSEASKSTAAKTAPVGTTPASTTSSSPSSGTTSTPSAASPSSSPEATHFISTAEAICKRLNLELSSVNSKLATKNGKLTVAAIIKGAPRNAILEQETLTELRRLRPPPALAASWTEILKLRGELAKFIASLGPTAQLKKSAVGALGLLKKEAHQKLTEVAEHASFNECGKVG